MFFIFLYFFLTIILGSLIRLFCVNTRLRSRVELPLPAILMSCGMLFGTAGLVSQTVQSFGGIASDLVKVESKFLILPAFIMRLVFSFDWLSFLKSISQVAVLGFFLFFISAVTTGAFVSLILQENIPLLEAIVSGAIMSTTDIEDLLDRYRQLRTVRIILRGEVLTTTTLAVIFYDIEDRGFFPDDDVIFGLPGWTLNITSVSLAFLFGYIFVKLLRREWFDINCYIILSFVSCYFLYWYASFYANFAIVPLVIFATMISPGTNHVEAELATTVRVLWEALDIGLKTTLAFDAGFKFVRIVHRVDHKVFLLFKTFAVYIFVFASRLVFLFYVYPVLAITGFRVDFPRIFILCLSGLQYTVALTYTNGLADETIAFSIGVVFLSQLINVIAMRPLISLLGLLIPPRSSEMDDIIRRLAMEKQRAVNTLKQNDLFTDVHWGIVDQVTTFQAVGDYQVMFITSDISDSTSLDQSRISELGSLREEAQHMILKAQKMAYERQKTQGLLKSEAYHILRAEVDAAFFQSIPVLNIDALRKYWTVGRLENFLRSCFSTSENGKTQLFDEWSGNWWHMLRSVWWEAFVALTAIASTALVIYHLIHDAATLDPVWTVLVSLHVALVGFQFIVEVAIVRGRGLWLFWHIIDMVVMISGIAYLSVVRIGDVPRLWQQLIYSIQLLRSLRLIWIRKVFKRIKPTIHVFLNDWVGNRLMLGYDMAKGFIIGQEEALKLLPMVVSSPAILAEMQEMLERDRLVVFKEIAKLQQEWPCLAIKIKAHESAHYILHHMALRVHEFHNNGLLDEEETNSLLYTINDTKYKAIRDINKTKPLSVQDMLLQLPWLQGESTARGLILSNAVLRSVDEGDRIFEASDEPKGIYIINYGLVETSYTPDSVVVDRALEFGALPNLDHPTSLNIDEKQVELKWEGNSFGELGVLTGRPCVATLTCQTPVLMTFIPTEILVPLLPQIAPKMWKAVAIRIAALLLCRHNFHGTMPTDEIKRVLTRSLCPDLSTCRRLFINDLVAILVLIEGVVVDNNGARYVAPTCIPETSEFLDISNNEDGGVDGLVPVRLLIVHDRDEDGIYLEIVDGNGYVRGVGEGDVFIERNRASIVDAFSKKTRNHRTAVD